MNNSVVTTSNGAAGGIVGYIGAGSQVKFDGCHVAGTSVSGTAGEGHFVGLFSGYDNSETLTFGDNCTCTPSVDRGQTVTKYREGNEATWLAGNDYTKFNDWLGDEECYRGVVKYGENRFIPKWDGETKIEPLKDGSTILIYSAFDLASLQGKSHSSVKFMEDVDLGGDRSDKTNNFQQISGISALEGNSKTIYNLYIEAKNWIGAFIGASSGTTLHKNLKFKNAAVVLEPGEGSELAYAAILCSYIEGNYTVQDVEIDGAYVLGISKSGGLNGFVTASASFYTAKNCRVNGLRIENKYLHLDTETFAASGEIGGLVGFIQQSALIESCSVTNSAINCKHSALRHVNQFIGTTRLDDRSQRIDINSCSVSGNTYESDKDEKNKLVGGFSLSILQKGKVYIDSKKI